MTEEDGVEASNSVTLRGGGKIEHESRKELKNNNKTSNLGSTDLKELTDLTECWHLRQLYCFSKFRLTGF